LPIQKINLEKDTHTKSEKVQSLKVQRSKDQKVSDLFKVVPQKILTPTNELSQSSNLSLQEERKIQSESFQKR